MKSPALAGGPGFRNESRQHRITPSAERGKRAAIALYCYGIVSPERVAAMFAHHPRWRSA